MILWAGCVLQVDVLDRAAGLHAGGFASMSLFTRDLYAWERRGGTLTALRTELDAREARVSCIDPYLAWYPGYAPPADGERASFLRATEPDVLRFAAATGATTISLVAPYDGAVAPFDAVVESLGSFADRAAQEGLRPHLEVVPRTRVADLDTAVGLVTAAGRPNLGLLVDTYNVARGGLGVAELRRVPAELVFAVQVADGAAEPVDGDPAADSLHHRRLPGEGDLPVEAMLECLVRDGRLPPLGPEVLSDELAGLPVAVIGERCATATRELVDRATTKG